MNFRNRWTMGLLGLGAAAILGVSASAVYAQTVTPEPNVAEGQQRPNRGIALEGNHTALLAEALGISEAELQAAITTARNATLDQAVADGRITQEQADEMKSREDGRAFGPGFGKEGSKEALASALGITVEELESAQQAVQAQLIADAVASGEITQEEADLMAARQTLQTYLQERLSGAYEEAIAQAVSDGVITQTQADLLLSQEAGRGFGGPGMGGGPRGGHMGRGGFGGENFDGENFGGERPEGGPEGQGRGNRGPGQSQSPLPEGTPESSSAPVVPANNTSL